MFDVLLSQRHLIFAMIIFIAGLYMAVMSTHILKRIVAINVMGAGVFYFLVAIGHVDGGVPPIVVDGEPLYVNPLPSAMILTGIVVVVSITVYSLSLALKIYEHYGTLEQTDLIDKENPS